MEQVRWSDLLDLDGDSLNSFMWELAEEAMRGLSGDDEDRGAADLPEPLRVIWLLGWLDFEVTQGSLSAYFFNSHGRFAAQAAEALETIGAHKVARVVRVGLALVSACADDWSDRRREVSAQGEFAVVFPYRDLAHAEDLATLTDEYWEAAEDDDWGNLLNEWLHVAVDRLART